MKLWMSSEADKKATRILSKLDIPIEEKFNNYLKDIGYKNEEIVKLRIIIIIRDDNFSAMKEVKKK